MTTTYTFVNATAARLFAEYWNHPGRPAIRCVTVRGSAVQINGKLPEDFIRLCARAAEAFNAAARSAREISQEEK